MSYIAKRKGRACEYCGSRKQAGLHLYSLARVNDSDIRAIYACRECHPTPTEEDTAIGMRICAEILESALTR